MHVGIPRQQGGSSGDWCFAVHRRGEGPGVVLLHGLLTDSRVWDPLTAELESDWSVAAFDAPGHGGSPPRTAEYTLEEETEALLAAVDRCLDGRPAVWIGHSMGGMKALRAALLRPEAVRALVLISTQPYEEPARTAEPYLAMVETVATYGMSADLAEVIGRMNFGRNCMDTPYGRNWVEHFSTLTSEQITTPCHSVYRRRGIDGSLGDVRAPTLVLHGTDDVPIRIDTARRYAAALPNASLVEIPGAHHTPPCEQPETVRALVRAFLDELPSLPES
jgi:pimeloyl-ACP methyl ester carboxylesterase